MIGFGLQGKAAIVTGASRGIGRAIALAGTQAGAQGTVSSRKDENLVESIQEIEEAGGQRSWPCRPTWATRSRSKDSSRRPWTGGDGWTSP